MKTYIKLLLPITLLTVTSCEDFLNREPQTEPWGNPILISEITSKYESAEGAITELNGLYGGFRNDVYQFELFMYNDAQSDNCYEGGDGIAEAEIENLKVGSLNEKARIMWGQLYGMVGDATSLIENTRMYHGDDLSEDEKNRMIAEGKFIRSYAYFDILRIWNDAPLMIKLIPPITASGIDSIYPLIYPERAPAAQVYDVIIKDVEDAVPFLESRSQGAFKATKGAAYALLAKMYATKGEKSMRNYAKVIEYCDKVVAEGYQLVEDFETLWDPGLNNGTKESIFEVDYNLDKHNWAYWILYSEEDGSVPWRRYCTPTHELIGKFAQQDKRFNSSIIYKSVYYDTYFPSDRYPFANKIRTKESNIILMRLADILLLKAEALAEIGDAASIASAIELVNRIRNRAGLPNLDTSMSQAQARLAVENERQLELLLEGHRWFDLLRNERMIEVMKNHRDKNGQIKFPNLSEHLKLWPIPQNEKDNNPKLTQNPGY